MQDKIIIKGAREHNLKNISLEIPRNKMIVFTGLSGSGKSSLAFDTIFAEGQRRYIESLSSYARQFLGGMQKPNVDEIEGLSPAISISQKAHSSNPRSTVATITEIYDYLRVLYARIGKPFCPKCKIGIEKMTIDEIREKVISNAKEKNKEGIISILSPVVRGRKGEYFQMLQDIYESGFLEVRIDGKIKSLRERVDLEKTKVHTIEIVIDKIPYLKVDSDFEFRLNEAIESAIDMSNSLCLIIYPDREEQVFSTEFSCPKCGFSFPEIEPRLFSFNTPYGFCPECNGLGTEDYFSSKPCPVCLGKRLNNNALSVKIDKKNIYEVTEMNVEEAIIAFSNLSERLEKKEREIAEVILNEIKNRLRFMHDVGLHYITLNRMAGILSGGESQRIRLASQVGTKLVGALYVLDEPTIGLHQRDNEMLIKTLCSLRDAGNTIIVVEHDEDTILASDWLVDFGPRAGRHGG
ncbi:MAG: ABC-ATPase UvrA, partial [Candidatus Pacebacteria bacterium]|nr:ABC-ATPase UvrA [Candidatus Paceibacterota bacterium]